MDALPQPITGGILVGLRVVPTAQPWGAGQAPSLPAPTGWQGACGQLPARPAPRHEERILGGCGTHTGAAPHTSIPYPTSRLGNHL